MRVADKVGAAIVATACALVWRYSHALPESTTLATVALFGAVAVAGMRLLREVAVCLERRTLAAAGDVTVMGDEPVGCSVGLLTVLAVSLGIAACLLGAVVVSLTPLRWTCLAVVILGVAFVMQDFHLSLRPFGLRHDPNHRRLARRQHS